MAIMKKTRTSNHVQEWYEKYFDTCVSLPNNSQARGCGACKFGRALALQLEVPRGLFYSESISAAVTECELLRRIVDQPSES